MEKINRNNYESYFLDFLEGTLEEPLKAELMDFLKKNPDLAKELDEFEMVRLSPEESRESWSGLKAPSIENLIDEEELRDQLYFRSVEGLTNKHDEHILNELLKVEAYRLEFEQWKSVLLTPGKEKVNREGMYQLPIELPISDSNYEDFLIAKTEGLLNEDKTTALHEYAAQKEGGTKDLALADQLKLEAPRGIFYPNKDELKKKEKKGALVFLYRAAAVILLIGIGAAAMTYLLSDHADPQYAQRETVDEVNDSLKQNSPKSDKLIPDSIPAQMDSPPLEDWEIIEPDPVFVAESVEDENGESSPSTASSDDHSTLNEEYAEVDPVEVPEEIEIDQEEVPDLLTPDLKIEEEELAQETPQKEKKEFKTIPQLAQEAVASQFDLSDEERNEIALNLAKKITQKAGEALDSEVKKEVDEDKDRLTYSLRIGGFKVTHNKAK
jgi:hypothetical protein